MKSNLRPLPVGWKWEGPAVPYLEWLDRDTFLKYPFALDKTYPSGMEDSVWILHAQYVCPAGEDPDDVGDVFLGSGFSPKPPSSWRRVLWKDVAAAKKKDLHGPIINGHELPPSDMWDAVLDRPLFDAATEDAFLTPSAGSMSQEDMEALIPILANHTSGPLVLGLPSYMTPEGLGDEESVEAERYVFSFDLNCFIKDLINDRSRPERFTPELWWPKDHSWLIWNDPDLMGTKVFGTNKLIQQIRANENLESLDWYPAR